MKTRKALVLLFALLTACTRSGAESPHPDLPQGAPVPSAQQADPHDRALALIAAADYQGAEALLNQAVTAAPRDADAWNDLSLVQASLAKWPEAVRSARKALELKPDMVYAKYNLGWALLHTEEWGLAASPLTAAAQAQPDRPEPLAALGRWYHMGAELHQAESLYARAAAMGSQPAKKLLAELRAEAAAPWEAVTAGTPNGVEVAAGNIASQKTGKALVGNLSLENGLVAELYADPTQTRLLVVLSDGLGYAMSRSPAGEPAKPRLAAIATPYGTHLLVSGEDGRMTEGWVLVPQVRQVTNALHARMDFGINVQGDAVRLSYRKYKQSGGYLAQASLWRYNSKSGTYEMVKPDQPGTQVITSSGLCNNFPVYLPLTVSNGSQSPDGFLAYRGTLGRWGHIEVTGGPYTTSLGVRVGDSDQRVTELYGASKDGFYQDQPPYGYTRFTFKDGRVASFTVMCDNTTRGPLGK